MVLAPDLASSSTSRFPRSSCGTGEQTSRRSMSASSHPALSRIVVLTQALAAMAPDLAHAAPWSVRVLEPAPPTPQPVSPSPEGPKPEESAASTAQPPEPPSGMGLVAGGIVLVLAGGAMIGGGAAILVKNPPDDDIESLGNGAARAGGKALIWLGALPSLIGIVLTASGISREAELKEWYRKRGLVRLTPSVTRGRHGSWLVGVDLAF